MNTTRYSHIYFSYEKDGAIIEMLETKNNLTVQHVGNNKSMLVIKDVDDPCEYAIVHPLEPFSYFMMELTGRSLPEQSLARQEPPAVDFDYDALTRREVALRGTTPVPHG